MRARIRVLLLLLAATVSVSFAQASNSNSNNDNKQQQRSIWDEPIRFSTKAKESCSMMVTGMGNYTRLRVSCRDPNHVTGRPYYCDFQGKPNLCTPYNHNPRHYFTQMMWELRKLNNACQGAKIYRPHMCKKYPDEVQMTFLTSWPKSIAVKPSKPVQEPRKPVVPAQTKPVENLKPLKPVKGGKIPQTKKPTTKPAKTTTHPTEQPNVRASLLESEFCWKSFQGICSFIMGWFQK